MGYSEDKNINGLDELTSLDDTDVLIAGDQSDSDRAKKITKANFEADLALTVSQVSDFDTEVASNSAVALNTAKDTNATHSGEVTGDGALTIADNVVDEANLKLDEAPTNGYVLTADSSKTGGMKWSAGGGTPEGTAVKSTGETVGKVLQADGDNTCSWVTLGGGGDALVANPLSQFASTTSLQLKGVLSDETGSGSAVFATSPTLVAPTLGVATATSVNGLGFTENADGFEISGGSSSERTLTVSGNDIDLVGSGSNTYTFPASDGTVELQSDNKDRGAINFVIDGGGSAITTGVKGFIEIPFNCTIEAVTLLADQSGSIVVDLWKDTYANYPPTDADTITASAVPTISSATKSQDSTLTGWTTSITAGDIIGFNVDSITTCERVTVSLKIIKSS